MKWQALCINTVTNKVIASVLPSLFKGVDVCSQNHSLCLCFAVYTLTRFEPERPHRVVIGTKCL